MLQLEIVTPEQIVVNETVDAVTVPTANGEAGILAAHAPLISTIKPGILSYTKGAAIEKFVVSGGFIEVSSDKVSVLADAVERAEQVNVEQARADRDALEKSLGAWTGSQEDFDAEKEKLEVAQARLQLAGK